MTRMLDRRMASMAMVVKMMLKAAETRPLRQHEIKAKIDANAMEQIEMM